VYVYVTDPGIGFNPAVNIPEASQTVSGTTLSGLITLYSGTAHCPASITRYVYAIITVGGSSYTVKMTGNSYTSSIPAGAFNNPNTYTDANQSSTTGIPVAAKNLYTDALSKTSDGKGVPTQGRFYTINGRKCVIRPYYLPGFNQYNVVSGRPYYMFVGSATPPPVSAPYTSAYWTNWYSAISLNTYMSNMASDSTYRTYLLAGKRISADIAWDSYNTLIGGLLPGTAYLQTSSISDENSTGNTLLSWNNDPAFWTGHTQTYLNIELGW
jgi:hypothetical protein